MSQWGSWRGATPRTPQELVARYPHGDVPFAAFPEDAWQKDAAFVQQYLEDAKSLVARAKRAIYAEYGYTNQSATQMFDWTMVGHNDDVPDKYRKRGDRGNGGWTTTRSYDGLVRRVLHALHTYHRN